jgi:hypothetical protein
VGPLTVEEHRNLSPVRSLGRGRGAIPNWGAWQSVSRSGQIWTVWPIWSTWAGLNDRVSVDRSGRSGQRGQVWTVWSGIVAGHDTVLRMSSVTELA